MCDEGSNAFDSLDGIKILEIANLSLDGPDLETIFFVDGDDSDDVAKFESNVIVFLFWMMWFI